MSKESIVLQMLRWLAVFGASIWWQQAFAVVLNGSLPPSPQQREALTASTVLFKSVAGIVCTATVVGNRALLTAAHCISVSTPVSAQFGGKRYNLHCGPLVGPGERRFDVALCISDQQFEGVRSARVDVTRSTALGESLWMAGYGCTEPGGLDRSGIGQLSVGTVRVAGMDVKLDSAPQEPPFVMAEGSSPCFGDAGGGVYRLPVGQTVPVVVGLMSRGDLAKTSFIVPLAATGLAQALRSASDDKGATICGLHDSGPSCSGEIVMQPAPDAAERRVELSVPGIELVSNSGLVKGQVVFAAGNGEESVAQAFRRVCGIPFDAVPGVSSDSRRAAEMEKAKTDEVLKLPPCPPKIAPQKATRTIQSGDTVWSIWKKLRATPTAAVLPPRSDEFAVFTKEFNQANPGVVLKPNVVVNVPPIIGAGDSTKAPVVAAIAAPQATPILSLSSTESAIECSTINPPAAHPYDLRLLLEVLALNRREELAQPSSVMILVADSGLQGGGQGIFSKNVLMNRIGEERDEFYKNIVPTVLDQDAVKHGTAVASVALGGPLFARMAVAQGQPRIQLAAQRIYYTPKGNAEKLDGVTADVSRFHDLIRIAEEQNAVVVNLSLRSTVPIPAIEYNLEDRKGRILFVAAAGNQQRRLSPNPAPDTEMTYPALYGGRARDRLITVMALNHDGNRPAFSNWGKEYVDIAAPGCAIPTLEWQSQTGRFSDTSGSGTSLAAPLVTFAAALVHSESGGRLLGRDLKRRILVSADLASTEKLAAEVEDGRRLNIVKAAAFSVDLLELADSPLIAGKVIFDEGMGPLADDGILQFKCKNDVDLRVQRRDLFKIARWTTENGSPRYVVYSRSSSGKLFSSDLCEQPSGVTLKLRKSDGVIETVGWDRLKDLVMRF